MSTTIEIDSISKAYVKNKPVLKPVSFTVEKGELFFLLGSSGCGKSTLLRIIAGLLKPDSGRIRFNGEDITALAPEKRRAAMVFQNYALWPHMSVFENVAFGLRVQHEKESVIKSKVAEMLDMVHLGDCASRKIQSLSGGQQQRIALARAMILDPNVLLLDEPLSNLDAKLRDEMRLEIRRICKERDLTAIYVTHDRKEALSMADRIAILHEGALLQAGTPRELYRSPSTFFAASFLGAANFMRAEVKSADTDTATVDSPCGSFAIPAKGKVFNAGDKVALITRPESISFERRSPDEVEFRGTVNSITFLGERTEYSVSTAGGNSMTVYETSHAERRTGTTCSLFAAPDDVTILPDASK